MSPVPPGLVSQRRRWSAQVAADVAADARPWLEVVTRKLRRVTSRDMTEEQPFEVVRRYDGFELRRYPSHVVAEVIVDQPFEKAGNTAFRYLFRYITGQNRSRTSVAMTAPVVQSDGAAQKVAMTAPVIQHVTQEGGYAVAFVLPASMTEEAAPEPTDPQVSIRTVLPSLAAVTRYSGRWSKDSYERHCRRLLQAIEAEGLKPVGTPRFARFDPPFKPWFLRRNEVVVDVDENPGQRE
jgi:hypothetical protein